MKRIATPQKRQKPPVLLTRDQFREQVFARDGHTCVFCDQKAVDSHHIIERRLFDDHGYYLENGASVCEKHHLECEMTWITVEQVREACGISRIVVPDYFYEDDRFDKWGNCFLPSGLRVKGELFLDPSVQKILRKGGVLDQFTNLVKYPRTMHLPWSEGMHDDDRMIRDLSAFIGKRVVVTEKMDGENTTLYTHATHARSVDGRHHYSRDWVKNFWAKIKHNIPEGWRVCGENLYAEHSIRYKLKSYFQGFSIWTEDNFCQSWDDTLEYFELLGVEPVKEKYRGVFDEKAIRALYQDNDWGTCEGYVVRLEESFHISQFRKCVAKFVRKNHVQTGKHWLYGRQVEKNELV
jgi:hypothetical protein